MSSKATPPFRFNLHQLADETDQSEGYLDSEDGTLFSVEFCDHDAAETKAVIAELERRLNTFDDLLTALKNLVVTAQILWDQSKSKPILDCCGVKITHPVIEDARAAIAKAAGGPE